MTDVTEVRTALSVRGLSVSYRGVRAVEDVNFDVPVGSCIALIGANGAGKTSTLRGISGLASVERHSEVRLEGERIDGLRPEDRALRGLGHVLEGRHIFPTLSVRENLELGAALGGGSRPERQGRIEQVLGSFPLLRELLRKPGASLSGGQQQFLAIARALAAVPSVLLLDEPSVGLAPELVDELGSTIRDTIASGVSVVLVEQALKVVQSAATHVYALSQGSVAGSRPADDPDLLTWAHTVYLQ